MKVCLLLWCFFPLSKPLKISSSKKPSPDYFSYQPLTVGAFWDFFCWFAPFSMLRRQDIVTYPFFGEGWFYSCKKITPKSPIYKVGWYTLQTFSDVYFREVRIHSQKPNGSMQAQQINHQHLPSIQQIPNKHSFETFFNNAVDGRNPAPPEMYKTR